MARNVTGVKVQSRPGQHKCQIFLTPWSTVQHSKWQLFWLITTLTLVIGQSATAESQQNGPNRGPKHLVPESNATRIIHSAPNERIFQPTEYSEWDSNPSEWVLNRKKRAEEEKEGMKPEEAASSPAEIEESGEGRQLPGLGVLNPNVERILNRRIANIREIDWNKPAPQVLPPVSKNPALFPDVTKAPSGFYPLDLVTQNPQFVPTKSPQPALYPQTIRPDLRNKPPSISINYYPPKDEHTSSSTTTERWRRPQNFVNLPDRIKVDQKYGQKTGQNRRHYFPINSEEDYTKGGSKVRPVVVDFARPNYNR